MNRIKSINILTIISLILIITGCKDLFTNPFNNKETGEKISFLMLDMNVFDTKLTFHIKDKSTGNYITGKEVQLFISGDRSDKVVDFEGKKNTTYTTSSGRVEVALDPQFGFSEADPFECIVNVVLEDQSGFAFPSEITITQIGQYDFSIDVITSMGLKSLQNPGDEPFDLLFNNDLLGNEWNYTKQISFQNGKTYYGMVSPKSKSLSGTLSADHFTGSSVLINNWGIEGFIWGKETFSLSRSIQLNYSNQSSSWFPVTQANDMIKCVSGINFKVKENKDRNGTGNIDYSLWINNEEINKGMIVFSTLPLTINTGAFYYPSTVSSVLVKFKGDAQYTIEPAEANLSNFCGSEFTLTAQPKEGLKLYQITVAAFCPGSVFGSAPSMGGEFKRKEIDEAWTQFKFTEGTCNLWLAPNQTYTVKGYFNSETATIEVPTDLSKIEEAKRNILQDMEKIQKVDFEVTEEENLININISLTYKEGKCPN